LPSQVRLSASSQLGSPALRYPSRTHQRAPRCSLPSFCWQSSICSRHRFAAVARGDVPIGDSSPSQAVSISGRPSATNWAATARSHRHERQQLDRGAVLHDEDLVVRRRCRGSITLTVAFESCHDNALANRSGDLTLGSSGGDPALGTIGGTCPLHSSDIVSRTMRGGDGSMTSSPKPILLVWRSNQPFTGR
jgi:hypothetical protein